MPNMNILSGRSDVLSDLSLTFCIRAFLSQALCWFSLPDTSSRHSFACQWSSLPSSHLKIISGRKTRYWSKVSEIFSDNWKSFCLFSSSVRYFLMLSKPDLCRHSVKISIILKVITSGSNRDSSGISGISFLKISFKQVFGKGKNMFALIPLCLASSIDNHRSIPLLWTTIISPESGKDKVSPTGLPMILDSCSASISRRLLVKIFSPGIISFS